MFQGEKARDIRNTKWKLQLMTYHTRVVKTPNHPEYAVTASGKKIGVDIFEEDGL